jgi:hypothetical protein
MRLEYWLLIGGVLGGLLAYIQIITGAHQRCIENNPLWWFCGF